MPPEPLDSETVAAIRRGDRGAFERLFRGWYKALADYAVRIVPTPDAAEDAVQEVFIAVWNHRETLPEAGKLSGYLYRAVRNRALNQLRGVRSASLDADDAIEPSVEASAETALVNADLRAALDAAIGALAPRTREVFLLSREQELTYVQIAETLGISVKTVETLMSRALKALRTALAASV